MASFRNIIKLPSIVFETFIVLEKDCLFYVIPHSTFVPFHTICFGHQLQVKKNINHFSKSS